MILVEMLSMFFPLIMIIFFIVIFVKKNAENRKNKERQQQQPQYHPSPQQYSRDEFRPWPGRFPGIEAVPAEPVPEPNSKAQEAVPEEVKQETLHILENAGVHPPAPADAGRRKRLEHLPELKRAIVWAEILGKPKGLR